MTTLHRSRATPRAEARSGFTLIELLVAMTLTMFLMTILVEAFSTAMDTFSGLRAVGELQVQLRTATNALKFDLSHDHFDGSRKLSDANFWNEPRREGFFYFRGGATVSEGSDWAGLTSERSTDHVLHFTVRLRGNRRSDYFSIPGATLAGRTTASNMQAATQMANSELGVTSQWAEVAYWLKPNGTTTPERAGVAAPIQLYKLYRTQLLVVPFTDSITIANMVPLAAVAKTSYSSTTSKFYSPNDLARGTSTRCFQLATPTNTPYSLLLNNVVSFQVRGMQVPAPTTPTAPFKALKNGTQTIGATTYDVFETGDTSALTSPSTPRIGAIQIILRVFDPSSGLTRQATLIQDM